MIQHHIRWFLKKSTTPIVTGSCLELNNASELQKIFKWQKKPKLSDPDLLKFEYIEDLNERRIRDAESIGSVVCNANPSVVLEIGTAKGHTTALIAENAPNARIYTINISPEEILSGAAGNFTTIALEKEDIGSYYRQKNIKNITQIYANSATWKPDIGNIDIVFIDGCHDAEFVYNDTKKVLQYMTPGSFILWHDFNPILMEKFAWIRSVCTGIEWLYNDGLLSGRIYHVKDSWVGVYRVS